VVLWRHEIGHLRRPPPALVRGRSLSTRFGIRERWAVEGSWVVDEDADFDGCGVGPFDAGHAVICYPSCGLLGLVERGCVP
jgi:hypothetical protein